MAESQFYPTAMTDEAFLRYPGRILWATMSTAFPAQMGEVINLSTYAAEGSWEDVGATKGGTQVEFNNSEETFDIDQILTNIQTLPSDVEVKVKTSIGQATLEWISFAWEGTAVESTNRGTFVEKTTTVGPFESYTQRRLAIGQRRASSGKLRLYVFRKVQRAPENSVLEFNKKGDQQSIAMAWSVLPDTSIAATKERFFKIFDQT